MIKMRTFHEALGFTMPIRTIWPALILILLGTGYATDPGIPEEAQKLLDTDRQFAKTCLQLGTAEAFRLYLHEDALLLSDGTFPVRCRDDIYSRMKSIEGNAVLSWEPREAQVSQSGELGWSWGTYTFSWQDDQQQTQTEHGKYLNIWCKDKQGQWKVLVDMGNQNPPPFQE